MVLHNYPKFLFWCIPFLSPMIWEIWDRGFFTFKLKIVNTTTYPKEGGDVPQPELFIGPDWIKMVPKVRNLGFVLNKNLTPVNHHKAVCPRFYSLLRSVRPHTRYTPFGVMKKLVVSLIMPHINYGNCWLCITNATQRCVQFLSALCSWYPSSGACFSSCAYYYRCFVGDSFEDSPFDVFVEGSAY
jgi:hypothetical protein